MQGTFVVYLEGIAYASSSNGIYVIQTSGQIPLLANNLTKSESDRVAMHGSVTGFFDIQMNAPKSYLCCIQMHPRKSGLLPLISPQGITLFLFNVTQNTALNVQDINCIDSELNALQAEPCHG